MKRTVLYYFCLLIFPLGPNFLITTLAGQEAPDSSSETSYTDGDDEMAELRRRLEALEGQFRFGAQEEVDLSGGEVSFGETGSPTHTLAKPWYEKISIWGYGAADYIMTGDAALRPNGGFLIREAAIYLEGEVWEDISWFFEIRTDYKGFDSRNVTTGEVYAHFRNLLKPWGDDLLGIKVGRVDIPFSEEYLQEHPPDNPLILNSAHWLYGTDEGIELYGHLSGLGWVLAVTDGASSRNIDDSIDKAVNLKVYGNPLESLYLSASAMRNGKTTRSAFRFGGSDFQPVGSRDPSTLGASPNRKIDAHAYGLDARWAFSEGGHLALSFGQGFVSDKDSTFDRDFLWWSVEALQHITPTVYGVVRYSNIGTYDSSKGYHFNGTFTAGGNRAFGYDTKAMQRLQLGLGWKPFPTVILKGEVGYDRFEMINVSPFDPRNKERWFVGTELVLIF